MNNIFRNQLEEICRIVRRYGYKIIVVEGYDCVGKGRVIEELSRELCAKVYRPNYNFWESHALPKSFRWVIGASLLDYFSSTYSPRERIIFDRGMLSGAVYNQEDFLLSGYKELLGEDLKILHILVITDEDSYDKFADLRGENSNSYKTYLIYERKFIELIKEFDLDAYLFINFYDKDYANSTKSTCQSCGHYSHNKCNNPKHIKSVKPTDPRCEDSEDKEVQD